MAGAGSDWFITTAVPTLPARRPTAAARANQPIRAPRGAAGLLSCSSESISMAIRSHNSLGGATGLSSSVTDRALWTMAPS